jgi:TrpR family transcriptional regulator, trp operon repressor
MKAVLIKKMTDLLWQIKDKDYMYDFLEDLFTEKELKDITERVQILRLLKQWKTQRDIAEEMKISVTTVNRGAKVLKNKNSAFNDLKITL